MSRPDLTTRDPATAGRGRPLQFASRLEFPPLSAMIVIAAANMDVMHGQLECTLRVRFISDICIMSLLREIAG